MMPSSIQRAMNSTADVLVYPMSSYIIDQTVKKSARVGRRTEPTAMGGRHHRAENKVPAAHDYSLSAGLSPAASSYLSRNRRRSVSISSSNSRSSSESHHPSHHNRRRRRSRRRRRRHRRPTASWNTCGHPWSQDHLFLDGGYHANVVAHGPDAVHAVRRSRRCSANVVLLAHGNRSLHVFAIQRTRVSVVHHRPGTAAVRHHHHGAENGHRPKYNYKLPGGQLKFLNGEQDDYDQQDRNTCSCPDDQRWYMAAIKHLDTIVEITVPLSRPGDNGDAIMHGHDDPPPFVPLGKWYRTRDKEARREELADDASSLAAMYYPYKPAHVGGQPAEQKRIYAVPDAPRLFHGQQLRLHVPRTKVRTVASSDSTTVTTTTTTYKCKFVPVARLHENGRIYGPILSSLPTVLSSLNLIYLP